MATLTTQDSGSVTLDGRNIDVGSAQESFTVTIGGGEVISVGTASFVKIFDANDAMSGVCDYFKAENLDATNYVELAFVATSATNYFSLRLEPGKSLKIPTSNFNSSAATSTPSAPSHTWTQVWALAHTASVRVRLNSFT